ncbi:hypothetical protein Tco_1061838, partial [Tanacetum coccineum]
DDVIVVLSNVETVEEGDAIVAEEGGILALAEVIEDGVAVIAPRTPLDIEGTCISRLSLSIFRLEVVDRRGSAMRQVYIEKLRRPKGAAEGSFIEVNEEIITAAVSPLFNKFTEVKVSRSQGILLDEGYDREGSFKELQNTTTDFAEAIGVKNSPMLTAKSDGNVDPLSSNIGFTMVDRRGSAMRQVYIEKLRRPKGAVIISIRFVSSFFVLHRHKTLQGNPIGEGNFVLQVVSTEFLINIKRDGY